VIVVLHRPTDLDDGGERRDLPLLGQSTADGRPELRVRIDRESFRLAGIDGGVVHYRKVEA
jgi:hypothetical protein